MPMMRTIGLFLGSAALALGASAAFAATVTPVARGAAVPAAPAVTPIAAAVVVEPDAAVGRPAVRPPVRPPSRS